MSKGKVLSSKNTMGTMMPHPPKGKMNTAPLPKSGGNTAPGWNGSPRGAVGKVKAAKVR